MIVEGYQAFSGRHWETGPVHNVLAFMGVTAPHTGQPFSEAMLLGLANGIGVQVVVYDYQDDLPDFTLATHWPFQPVKTLLKRLRIKPEVKETTSEAKGYTNLLETLAGGVPAIVWADRVYFDYAGLKRSTGMKPLVVYGVDEAIGAAYVADRAQVALAVTLDQLAAGRAAQVNLKHRVVALTPPRLRFLKLAIEESIAACVSLYVDDPPKGSPSNFGLRAFDRWTDTLLSPSGKRSWAKLFPPGPSMFRAMTRIYHQIQHIPAAGAADRGLYADFLDEAAQAIDAPLLAEAAADFRECAGLWIDFAEALLPAGDDLWGAFTTLAEAKIYLDRIHELFMTRGGDSLPERLALSEKLQSIEDEMLVEFPFDDDYVTEYKKELAQRLRGIQAAEQAAVEMLKGWLEG